MRKIFLASAISYVLYSPAIIAVSVPEPIEPSVSTDEAATDSIRILSPNNHQVFSIDELIPIEINSEGLKITEISKLQFTILNTVKHTNSIILTKCSCVLLKLGLFV